MQITIFPYAPDLGQSHCTHTVQKCLYTLYKSFQLRICTVNETEHSFTFAGEILNWKLHSLHSDRYSFKCVVNNSFSETEQAKRLTCSEEIKSCFVTYSSKI